MTPREIFSLCWLTYDRYLQYEYLHQLISLLYLNSEGRKVLLLESGRSDGVDAGLGEIHNNWGASGLKIFNADY